MVSKKAIKIILLYALVYGLLHHLFHLWVQPMLNQMAFFQNLPPVFLGSTFGVTLFTVKWFFIFFGLLLLADIISHTIHKKD